MKSVYVFRLKDTGTSSLEERDVLAKNFLDHVGSCSRLELRTGAVGVAYVILVANASCRSLRLVARLSD